MTNVEKTIKNFAGECFRFWVKETNGDLVQSAKKTADDMARITTNPNLPSGGSEEFKKELAELKQTQRYIELVKSAISQELHKLGVA